MNGLASKLPKDPKLLICSRQEYWKRVRLHEPCLLISLIPIEQLITNAKDNSFPERTKFAPAVSKQKPSFSNHNKDLLKLEW